MPGGWHHGDDIFASLGEPVVAVANGTVFSVGWEKLGGWRLWLRDKQGNRFYYAHLSGYTKLARNRMHVHAGQQLGFVGNTGDAFTTPRHLHFEIHPKRFRKLGYNGAVDPTTYLQSWEARHARRDDGARAASARSVAPRRRRRQRLSRAARRARDPAAAVEARCVHVGPPPAAAGINRRRCRYRVADSLARCRAGAGLVSLLVVSAFAFRRRRRSVG